MFNKISMSFKPQWRDASPRYLAEQFWLCKAYDMKSSYSGFYLLFIPIWNISSARYHTRGKIIGDIFCTWDICYHTNSKIIGAIFLLEISATSEFYIFEYKYFFY